MKVSKRGSSIQKKKKKKEKKALALLNHSIQCKIGSGSGEDCSNYCFAWIAPNSNRDES